MQNNFDDIPGIGEKTAQALKRLDINSSLDLLFHLPIKVSQKQLYSPIYTLKEGDMAVLKLEIIGIDRPNNPHNSRGRPFKIYCANSTGKIDLVYFSYFPQYLLNWAKIGSEIIVSGKVTIYDGLRKISHPDVQRSTQKQIAIDPEDVIYPLTYGIINKQLQKYINFALDQNRVIDEWIDDDIIKQHGWPSFAQALKRIHSPKNNADITPYSPERQRLAYDELLATQLMVHLLRSIKQDRLGRSLSSNNSLRQGFIKNLPFVLTHSQEIAIQEISEDQASSKKMSRLLQGDVGSGKTIVAIAAMLNAVESKAQAVMMAPTDILANQHFKTLELFLQSMPVKYAILTGKTKPKERKHILAGLLSGEIDILVGTHAVFQDKVAFADLALVVIDEQHRFGVQQRLALLNKGNDADLLIMSATPIPRSLSLVLYGDMDVTRINEKPKSRIPIKTSVMSSNKLNELVDSLGHIINNQGKIYWICPLVNEAEEPSEQPRKTAAESRMQALSTIYPGIVGLVHGQLDSYNKQDSLQKFVSGDIRILVATTVIEVGVDVPDATVIIIENAECFGLSQLHQLRGRVGRGDKPSHCVLLYNPPIGNISKQRLNIIKDTEDGFILAEEDLKIRGGGNIVGTKQSGLPNFKIVDFIAHHHLIGLANTQAQKILSMDHDLSLPINRKYRQLLKIFDFSHQSIDW